MEAALEVAAGEAGVEEAGAVVEVAGEAGAENPDHQQESNAPFIGSI
jgi:hypothetical protein